MNPFTSAVKFTHVPRTEVSRASIMSAFNMARDSGKFEHKRLCRALGIAQSSKMTILPHSVIDITSVNGRDFYLIHVNTKRDTIGHCTCEDVRTHRPDWWCKHRIACALTIRAYQMETNNG